MVPFAGWSMPVQYTGVIERASWPCAKKRRRLRRLAHGTLRGFVTMHAHAGAAAPALERPRFSSRPARRSTRCSPNDGRRHRRRPDRLSPEAGRLPAGRERGEPCREISPICAMACPKEREARPTRAMRPPCSQLQGPASLALLARISTGPFETGVGACVQLGNARRPQASSGSSSPVRATQASREFK